MGQSLIEDTSVFRPDLVVADVVYNPKETKFVQDAKAAGCKVAVGGYRYAAVAGRCCIQNCSLAKICHR